MTTCICKRMKFQTNHLSFGLVFNAHASRVCHLQCFILHAAQQVFEPPLTLLVFGSCSSEFLVVKVRAYGLTLHGGGLWRIVKIITQVVGGCGPGVVKL